MKYKRLRKFILMFVIAIVVCMSGSSSKATGSNPGTTIETDTETEQNGVGNNGVSLGLSVNSNSEDTSLAGTLQILLVITIISLAPSILVMVTSFTRIVVVLHFVRTAIGTQSSPPNNVLIGLSLFLTLFIMAPVFSDIKTEALDPLTANEITQEEALDRGLEPLRDFMFNQVRQDDLRLFMDIARMDTVENLDEIPTTVLIPAFIISELRASFIIGFLIYIPFIILDMVVASVLMSMGMMMLPPTTISMPFKILLFILADGWNLIIGELVKSFNY